MSIVTALDVAALRLGLECFPLVVQRLAATDAKLKLYAPPPQVEPQRNQASFLSNRNMTTLDTSSTPFRTITESIPLMQK